MDEYNTITNTELTGQYYFLDFKAEMLLVKVNKILMNKYRYETYYEFLNRMNERIKDFNVVSFETLPKYPIDSNDKTNNYYRRQIIRVWLKN